MKGLNESLGKMSNRVPDVHLRCLGTFFKTLKTVGISNGLNDLFLTPKMSVTALIIEINNDFS